MRQAQLVTDSLEQLDERRRLGSSRAVETSYVRVHRCVADRRLIGEHRAAGHE